MHKAKTSGEIIKEEIKKRGSTQEKDAKAIGITQSALSDFISGKREFRSDALRKVCKFYNISADYLLGISNVPSTDPDDTAICEKIGCSIDALNALKRIYSGKTFDLDFDEESLKVFREECDKYNKIMLLAFDIFISSLSSEFYGKYFIESIVESICLEATLRCFDERTDDHMGKDAKIKTLETYADTAEYNLTKMIPEILHECVSELIEQYDIDFSAENGWKLIDRQTEEVFAEKLGYGVIQDQFSKVYSALTEYHINDLLFKQNNLMTEEYKRKIASLERIIADLCNRKETDHAEEE